MTDPVKHPSHYTDGPAVCRECGLPIECIDIAQHYPFSIGSVFKYLWRHGRKGGPETALEDLRKAAQYIKFEIERLEAAS